MGGTATGTKGVLCARLRRGAPPQAKAAPAPVPPPAAPSVERLAAAAAARAASRAGRLPATAEAATSQGISLPELPELLPERALIAVIEAGGDRLGVAALCPTLLASLIEVQAIGHVTGRPVTARRPTRADAALAAEFVNHLLDELGGALSGLPGHAALAGYRYASHLDDPRPLSLMLEDGGFRAIRVDLRLGAGGERRGTLFVAVPATPSGEAPPLAVGAAPAAAVGGVGPARPRSAHQPAIAATLAPSVRQAPIPLVAVLCRRRISLRELRTLKPGDTISLPKAAVDDVWLETGRGQKLARGKLGEVDGCHALRLRHSDLPSARAAAPGLPAGQGDAAAPGVLAAALPPGNGPLPVDPAAPAPLAEPPIGDLTAPDAFRVAADHAEEAPVLPIRRLQPASP